VLPSLALLSGWQKWRRRTPVLSCPNCFWLAWFLSRPTGGRGALGLLVSEVGLSLARVVSVWRFGVFLLAPS